MMYPYPGYCGSGLTELTEVPDKGVKVLQNFQKFRVRVRMSYRTSRSSGYCGTGVQNSQKFRASSKHDAPVPRVLWPRAYRTSRSSGYRTSRSSGYRYEFRTELPEVSGTGVNVLQNLHEFFVG